MAGRLGVLKNKRTHQQACFQPAASSTVRQPHQRAGRKDRWCAGRRVREEGTGWWAWWQAEKEGRVGRRAWREEKELRHHARRHSTLVRAAVEGRPN